MSVKVEQRLHQGGVIRHRVHHIHHHAAQSRAPYAGQVHVMRFDDLVSGDRRRTLEHRFGHALGCRAAIGHIELHTEVLMRPAGVVRS